MAVLRLQLEIDSDVYPELHARLIAIQSEGGRTERMRQLAASGLVWETLRMLGPPASPAHATVGQIHAQAPVTHAQPHAPTPTMQPHMPAGQVQGPQSFAKGPAPGATGLASEESSAMASEQASLAPARSSAAAPRRTAAPSPRPDPHFVDLAIDAVPPRPMEPRGLRTVPGELDSLLGAENDRLPVLQDVVEPHAISTMPGRLDDGDTTERATPAFTDTHPLPAWAEPSQPAGPRSRLMRMKERGLFKNT